MKRILKTNWYLLAILFSIGYIYSGCCCKKKKNKNGSNKTNSTGTPSNLTKVKKGSPDDHTDASAKQPKKAPDKYKKLSTDPNLTKPEDEAIQKKKEEEAKKKKDEEDRREKIKDTLIKLMNTRDSSNREMITDKWTVEINSEGVCTITFGLFKCTISKDQIYTIDVLDDNQIKSIPITMEMTRNDNSEFKFSGDGKCTLKNLVDSLNNLRKVLRVNNTEHLYVKLTVGSQTFNRYINLSNGLIYYIDCTNYIGRSYKNSDIDYSGYKNPFYTIYPEKFRNWEGQWKDSTKDYNDDLTSFNTPLYTKEDIDKFTLTVQS